MAPQQMNTIVKVVALYVGFAVLGVLFFMFFEAGLDVELLLK